MLQHEYDVVWLCYPSDQTYLKLDIKPKKLIKEVASWRWRENYQTTQDFIQAHLLDADYIACPSKELYTELSYYCNNVLYMPNGVENRFFTKKSKLIPNGGHARFGWVGNPNDPLKNFEEIKNIQEKGISVKIAQNLNLFELRKFYKKIDVLLITSTSESQPLPFLEALASGCSIITRPVGIIPEFADLEKVLIVPFEKSILDSIINNKFSKNSNNQECKSIKFNSWDSLISIYKEFYESVISKKINVHKFNIRYSNIENENHIILSMFKYKVKLYLDWKKYGNTKT